MDLNNKFGSNQNTMHESFKIAQKSKLTALGHFLPKEKLHVYNEVYVKAFYTINYVCTLVPVWRLLAL